MVSLIYSAGLAGIDGYPVSVECSVRDGLERFDIVGLPGQAVKESRERIRTVLNAVSCPLDDSTVTVNLAPAATKKEGSAYDVAIAVGVLSAMGALQEAGEMADCVFLGELSLSGSIRPVPGVLSMVMASASAGMKRAFVPAANAREAAVVSGIDVYGMDDLPQLIRVLRGRETAEKAAFHAPDLTKPSGDLDFADVRGQAQAKRAMEIAAAGGHNILLIGPPGTGKSMLAKRLPTILPPMTFEEALETTRVHSIAGELPADASLLTERPFRAPHHTMSAASLAGGGTVPRPGELSLAHNGVLFLDELPEYQKSVTEVLRQPLEDGQLTITRAAARYTFPAQVMLVAAMNPCRCGYFGCGDRCTCKPADVKEYLSRISGPLLDRIDIQVEMPLLEFDVLSDNTPGESSAVVRERVVRARDFAAERLRGTGVSVPSNGRLTSAQLRRTVNADDSAYEILRAAFERMGMSARGYDRILRVARTIADLDASETVSDVHVAEAVQLRSLDRKYWRE